MPDALLFQAVSIDSFVAERNIKHVNLIELDVEGSELEVLVGAVDTISRYKPKLQISLYHNEKHLWELSLFVHKLVPQYKLYIGHHTLNFNETMLYAHAI